MKKLVAIIVSCMLFVSVFAISGQDVLNLTKESYENISNAKAFLEMKVSNEDGNDTEMEFVIYILRKSEDQIYAMVRFLEPESNKNLTLLTRGDNEIYLYMPALRNTKRISGAAQNDKFADSDFTYKDISLLYKISDKAYNAKLLDENSESYLLEITHNDRELNFSKMKMVIGKANMMPNSIEFYNWNDEMFKTIELQEFKEVDGHVVPQKIVARDLKSEGQTTIFMKEMNFDLGMDEKFFTPKTISRPKLKY